MGAERKVLIETTQLRKVFKIGNSEQVVLDDIDLKIYDGDFTVVMGVSGSGKSTLLNILAGMTNATSGQILFDGKDISKLSSDKLAKFRRDNCGFVFQDRCLVEGLDGMDNVMIAGLAANNNRKQVREKAIELFEKMDITPEMQQKLPHEMSGGIAQRIGIARALIISPQIVFADEPTGALNSANSKKVLDIMNQINGEGQNIVMVTHDIASACRGNRILYLRDGKIMSEYKQPKYTGEDSNRLDKLKEFLNSNEW